MSYSAYRPHPTPATRAGSPLATLSIVFAVINFVSFLLFIIVRVTLTYAGYRPEDEEAPIYYLYGTWMFGVVMCGVVGLVFGVGAMLRKPMTSFDPTNGSALPEPDGARKPAVIGMMLNLILPILILFFLAIAGATGASRVESKSQASPANWRTIETGSPAASSEPEASEKSSSWATSIWIGIAVAITILLVQLRKKRVASGSDSEFATRQDVISPLADCPRCGKELPGGVKFCRRCGETRVMA